MTNIEAMQLIMKTYKFEIAVPEDARMFFIESSKKNLIFILKKFGKCGVFTLFAIYLLFYFKKLGFTMSLMKIYAIVVISSVVTAGTAAAATAIIVKKVITDIQIPVEQQIDQPVQIEPSALTDDAKTETSVKPVSRLRKLYDTYKHVEKVYLKDGTILTGVVIEKENSVQIITPEGTLVVTKDDIQSVEYLPKEKI